MKNILKLSSYAPLEDIGLDKTDYIFYYNLLTAEKTVRDKFIKRWHAKIEAFQKIQDVALTDSHRWEEEVNEVLFESDIDSKISIGKTIFIENLESAQRVKYTRDLRGIRIFDSTIKYPFHSFNDTRLDYSLIENSNFVGVPDTNPRSIHTSFTGFFATSFNHSRFNNCNFENYIFWSGEYRYVVFYNCTFKKSMFNRNRDGIYHHILSEL
jgi:hypothetical protein